ncbi:hypothetical protein U91I_00735 [alpha proteobacterium U9-1i]|nr:hypothetical protein U91I_00735 [alpha proteobacterium U9-1i]
MDGDDSESIIIIDDFLSKPHEMRQRGLEAVFPRTQNSPYPGRNSSQTYELRALDQIVSKLTGGQTLVPAPNTSHGSFRLCLANEQGGGGVHIDTCHWSSILYLSLPEHCQGGTDFFRHRATRTIRAPVFPGEKEQLPMSWDQLRQDMLGPNAKDPTRWERVRHVEMRFNRFVLFRPWLWHDAGPGFGDSHENGRLIYVAFYNCIDPGWV